MTTTKKKAIALLTTAVGLGIVLVAGVVLYSFPLSPGPAAGICATDARAEASYHPGELGRYPQTRARILFQDSRLA